MDGDVGKLHLASDLSGAQKKLLANMHFRCAQVSGTQEIRRKIGHIGTWAAVQYGLGIFMTVSPGDRAIAYSGTSHYDGPSPGNSICDTKKSRGTLRNLEEKGGTEKKIDRR